MKAISLLAILLFVSCSTSKEVCCCDFKEMTFVHNDTLVFPQEHIHIDDTCYLFEEMIIPISDTFTLICPIKRKK